MYPELSLDVYVCVRVYATLFNVVAKFLPLCSIRADAPPRAHLEWDVRARLFIINHGEANLIL